MIPQNKEEQVDVENSSELEDVVHKVAKMSEHDRQIIFQELEIYQGDLPHPKILEGYNNLYPDAAKRIIENGIKESEHRRRIEDEFLKKQFSERKRGQWLGFILAIFILSIGGLLISMGHTIIGSIFSGVTTLGLIGMFAGSNSTDNNKNKNNDKADKKD